jgi:hypothetical protein
LECLFGSAARDAGIEEDVDGGDGLDGVDVNSIAEGAGRCLGSRVVFGGSPKAMVARAEGVRGLHMMGCVACWGFGNHWYLVG